MDPDAIMQKALEQGYIFITMDVVFSEGECFVVIATARPKDPQSTDEVEMIQVQAGSIAAAWEQFASQLG